MCCIVALERTSAWGGYRAKWHCENCNNWLNIYGDKFNSIIKYVKYKVFENIENKQSQYRKLKETYLLSQASIP